MFALFFNLYYSMFTGTWYQMTLTGINTFLNGTFNKIGEMLTSLFNNVETPVTDFGTIMTTYVNVPTPLGNVNGVPYLGIIAFVLALITSIGIVVIAVKGVKKAFGIFFGQIR